MSATPKPIPGLHASPVWWRESPCVWCGGTERPAVVGRVTSAGQSICEDCIDALARTLAACRAAEVAALALDATKKEDE